MDTVTFGRGFKALRLRKRLRPEDLGAEVAAPVADRARDVPAIRGDSVATEFSPNVSLGEVLDQMRTGT